MDKDQVYACGKCHSPVLEELKLAVVLVPPGGKSEGQMLLHRYDYLVFKCPVCSTINIPREEPLSYMMGSRTKDLDIRANLFKSLEDAVQAAEPTLKEVFDEARRKNKSSK